MPSVALPRPVAVSDGPRRCARPERTPLGRILLDRRAVDPGHMLRALALQARAEARLGDILLAHRWVDEADLVAALCEQWGAEAVDLAATPPDARLIESFGAERCLAEGVVPWRRVGAVTVIATARPEAFARLRQDLRPIFGRCVPAIASERAVRAAIASSRDRSLARKAETRTPERESCRGMGSSRATLMGWGALATLALAGLLAPGPVFVAFALWAIVTLFLTTALKALAFWAEWRAVRRASPALLAPSPGRLPVVSVMVPLFREDDIAPRLVARLGRIDYPRELLDIVLVVEEVDTKTQAALARVRLPNWMRLVLVPDGPIRTKPRALNYALAFCRGRIIGVWDAEDAPEPGQIHQIVRRFAEVGPEVACLQGVLDYYNADHNWLTRCFTVEYAAWFRAMLPGLARLGLVVPLGGTTVFFRREALEDLGGWDAHNVTEDADLGLRLARHGYRTELVATVTEEEPNCRVLPWIRQRSRWQKGYAITWAVHMRDPVRLWRELGARGFWGVQILFLGSLSQAVLAPVLWSFWALSLGLPHPAAAMAGSGWLAALWSLFMVSEAVTLASAAWSLRGRKHRHLIKWVPLMHLYMPLASLSSYKAIYEVVCRPFYWDKTAHGIIDGAVGAGPARGGGTLKPALIRLRRGGGSAVTPGTEGVRTR
ncbi:glycosyltransferase [Albidovulum sediminicola]|uniref:Glycosyltransferase n=1 Tax=Albidovulum sediminicola TaxID=2984331 RepID=A0ABT2Z185_9RHOB|nr:glycosyltransferase [Defluviimonas sp. WL0075]MCV2864858.1 glycosyltransferase [Defluviimonas sp. WL0075]